ncbi:TetR family transcriptional regulator, partial [Priestia sp. SIMBA_032]|uniref:TetR family transcriptional regulator n=1 Tax=Priestia sp. SIMBA_032 TaxID=3085775 RepID=UPI00397B6B74
GFMGRWEPGARERLVGAAIELYADPGFEQTTVADIAERAGVTERTFFRYFADKREVLFAGSDLFQEAVLTAIAAAPS